MNIVKPSVDGALSFIAKGIKQLESAIADRSFTAQKARETIAKADADMKAAQADIERATRIKAKLAELIA